MKRTHYLIANIADGTRMAFDFANGKWTGPTLTDAHKSDGSIMCRIMAEVNAEVMCIKIKSLFWTKA